MEKMNKFKENVKSLINQRMRKLKQKQQYLYLFYYLLGTKQIN